MNDLADKWLVCNVEHRSVSQFSRAPGSSRAASTSSSALRAGPPRPEESGGSRLENRRAQLLLSDAKDASALGGKPIRVGERRFLECAPASDSAVCADRQD